MTEFFIFNKVFSFFASTPKCATIADCKSRSIYCNQQNNNGFPGNWPAKPKTFAANHKLHPEKTIFAFNMKSCHWMDARVMHSNPFWLLVIGF